jgi:hypothetical protein
MKPTQAIKHFRTQAALAAAFNPPVTQPCVANWVKRGSIPALRQLELQAVTGGVLKADRSVSRKVSQN